MAQNRQAFQPRDFPQLYRLLVSELRDYAIFVTDTEGIITTWNPGVELILGYSEAEFIGKHIAMVFTDKDRAEKAFEFEMAGAREHGRAPDVRWHLRKDGSLIFVDGVLNVLRDEAGELLGYTKVMRDITPGRGIGGLIQTILEATDQRIFVKDRESRYAFANSAVAAMFGRQVEEVIGKCDSELQPGELSDELEEHDRRVIDSAQRETVEETVLVPGRGATTYLTTKAPWHDIEGNVVGVVGIAQDISERKQAEENLRTSEERFRKVFLHVPIGMALTSPDGRLLYVNPAYCEIVGYTPEELRETNFLSLTHPDDVPQNRVLHTQLLAGEIPSFAIEKRYIRKGGRIVWVRAGATVLREEAGKPTQIVGIVEDIQDRKNAEAALLRANEELSQFAHVVAHDLQAPLRSIRSYTELLAKRCQGRLDATAEEFLQFIKDGGAGMDHLIRALLHYAEAGGQEVDRKQVRVHGVIDAVCIALQSDIEEAGAEITTRDLPTVPADRVQLTQLFQNLIGNALKYRRKGIKPRIEVCAEPRPGGWVFSVKDNGPGIDPIHYERIFEPLRRLHGQEIPGTGLGLAVCRKIVARHGGRIWVESKVGEGATFSFTLPA